jgi:hypothetical protein
MHTLLIVIGVLLLWLVLHGSGPRAYKAICRNCESVAKSRIVSPRNFFIEILLWFCGLVPGVIYTLWCNHQTHNTCRKCGSEDIIPVDSPAGQKLAGGTAKAEIHISQQPISQEMRRK